jgi:hypothetical protein
MEITPFNPKCFDDVTSAELTSVEGGLSKRVQDVLFGVGAVIGFGFGGFGGAIVGGGIGGFLGDLLRKIF